MLSLLVCKYDSKGGQQLIGWDGMRDGASAGPLSLPLSLSFESQGHALWGLAWSFKGHATMRHGDLNGVLFLLT